MGFFDKYSSKVKEEKKRFLDSYNLGKEIPDFYFSKKILKIFPDINQRDDVYFYLNGTTSEIYEQFLELAETNKQMALQLVNDKITLSEQLFQNIEKLSYPFSYDVLNENVINKLLQFKSSHSLEIYYKLCDFYIKNPKEELLDIANEIKNNDFWSLNINELYDIYSMNNIEKQNKLIYFINNKDINYYLVYKSVVKEYDKEIDYVIKVLEDNKFSPEYIEIYLSPATNRESLAHAIKNNSTGNLTKDKTYKYFEYIDTKFEEIIQGKSNNYLNVEELKKELFLKFTGLSSFEYHNLLELYEKFNYTIPQDLKVLFDLLNKIEMCKDADELINILNNRQPTMSREHFLEMINNLKLAEQSYSAGLYKDLRTGNDIEYKEYNGKQIEYIKFNGTEFNILCHRINASRNANGLPNRNIVDELLVNPANFTDNQTLGSDYLACSLIYEGNLNTFSNGMTGDVLLAFSDLSENRILGTFGSDHGSETRGSGQDKSKGNVITDLHTLDELKSKTFSDTYNEVTISRKENGVKKKPDYMIVIKNGANNQNVGLNENCLRYAAYYNIPILEIDVQRLNYNIDKKNREKKEQLEQLKQTLIEQSSYGVEQTLENSRTI